MIHACPTKSELAEAAELCPGAFGQSPAAKLLTVIGWLAFTAFTVYALDQTGFFNLKALAVGFGKLLKVASFMFPPRAEGFFLDFVKGILETLAMAFLGTLLAAVASIPLGFLGAKNVITNPIFHISLRLGFDGVRGVDALIWALIWVSVVGLGPFSGILAIAVADTGTLSKLFAEAIENIDKRQVEGVKASGANDIQIMRYAILPQVLPVFLSQALYFFESNTRSATILGVVGAGGIGLLLSDRIRINAWDQAMFIIIMVVLTVALIDMLSRQIRQAVINSRN